MEKMFRNTFLIKLLCLALLCRYSVGFIKLCISNSDDVLNHDLHPDNCADILFGEITSVTSLNSSEEIMLSFGSSSYDVREVITFADKFRVELSSVNGTTTFQCQSDTSGIQFNNVTSIEIKSMQFYGCGFASEHSWIFSCLYIHNCGNITLSTVVIENSLGLGLSLIDNHGNVVIVGSTFSNQVRRISGPGGGVFVKSSLTSGTKYFFNNCTFNDNKATGASSHEHGHGIDNETLFHCGGGMKVYFQNMTSNIQITLSSCHFSNNSALNGGGLQVFFNMSSNNITVVVEETDFEFNSAQKRGGGASIGYIHDSENMVDNIVQFTRCRFTNNSAMEGGGLHLYAAPDYNHCKPMNHFSFVENIWTGNNATLGSAVHIIPFTSPKFIEQGLLPKPMFHNCTFTENIVKYTEKNSTYNFQKFGKGTLYSNEIDVALKGLVTFTKNQGSSVFMVSSILNISSNSNIIFKDNVGYTGGAITLQRNSAIHITDNTSILFDTNMATALGGAIYHDTYTDPSDTEIHQCFIKYVGDTNKNMSQRNISVHFTNNRIGRNERCNSAQLEGLSIYLFSLIPCINTYHETGTENVLRSIANITFDDYLNFSDVSTLGSNFGVSTDIPTTFFPGKETDLNIEIIDDTNTIVTQDMYSVTLKYNHDNKENGVEVDPAYHFVSNNKIKLIGIPGSKAELNVLLFDRPDFQLSFDVTLKDCPPGYIYENKVCICSANTEHNYHGIKRCNLSNFTANLIQGFWAGYMKNDTSEDSFRTSICPLGFCKKVGFEISLPENNTDLSKLLCQENRLGKLCSLCAVNTSLYYHAKSFCGSNKHCSWGILFYFLIEILPVTIFFLVIILFDVKLSSGSLYGFIFYVQVFDTLEVTASNFITFPKNAKILLTTLKFIIGMFNLEFFLLPKLSFCLFENANYLHLLMFSYITIFYSMLLVLLTVFLMNSRFSKHIRTISGRKKYRTNSIIHGLSSFLVICYARSTKTSLQILDPVTLFGKRGNTIENVVYYHGEYDYFKSDHQPFAIPALVILLLMTCLPVVLLLAYPACYQIFAILKLQESKLPKIICRVFPLENFKPFFDSFQSTFKDKHRYFAGLFFLYRFTILMSVNASNSLTMFYFVLELQLIIVLAMHAIIQPHKKSWHNQIDISILALLAIINGLTYYNYQLTVHHLDHTKTIQPVLCTIQVFLAYLPLLYIVGCLVMKLKKRICHWYLKHKKSDTTNEHHDNDILEMLDQDHVDEDHGMFDTDYHQSD